MKNGSYTIIGLESKESLDIEVFYKGKKVINVSEMKLYGVGFKFENSINWRKLIENERKRSC